MNQQAQTGLGKKQKSDQKTDSIETNKLNTKIHDDYSQLSPIFRFLSVREKEKTWNVWRVIELNDKTILIAKKETVNLAKIQLWPVNCWQHTTNYYTLYLLIFLFLRLLYSSSLLISTYATLVPRPRPRPLPQRNVSFLCTINLYCFFHKGASFFFPGRSMGYSNSLKINNSDNTDNKPSCVFRNHKSSFQNVCIKKWGFFKNWFASDSGLSAASIVVLQFIIGWKQFSIFDQVY